MMVVPAVVAPVMPIAADPARTVMGQDNPASRIVVVAVIIGRPVIAIAAVEMMPVPDAKPAAMKAAVEAAAMEASAMEASAMKRHAAPMKTTSMETAAVKPASVEASSVEASATVEAATASMETAATMTAAKAHLGRRAIRNWSGRRHRGRIDRRHRLCALTSGSGQ